VKLRAIAALLLLGAAVVAPTQEQTVFEQWAEVLAYGIDSEVIDLLDQIREHGTDQFDEAIAERFAESRSAELRVAVLEYFAEKKSNAIAGATRSLFLSDDLLSDDLLRAIVAYLSDVVEDDTEEVLERYLEMAEESNVLAASIAIQAVGGHPDETVVQRLLDLYQEVEPDDLKAAVLRALGETGSAEAVDFLTEVLTDEYEVSLYRQYAATALGRIAAPESQATLTTATSSEDPLVRASAIAALGHYTDEEAAEILTSALRDSFWRARVAAIQALAEQRSTTAVPAIVYKARRDPEQPVRQAAISALGEIGDPAALTALRSIAADERATAALRTQAVEVLAQSDFGGSVDQLMEIIAAEWEVDGSSVLEAIGRAVSAYGEPAVEPLALRLLEHPNYIIQIYAIRAIGRAGLFQHADRLKAIADDSPPGIIRTSALAALEQMGIAYDPDASDETDDTGADGSPDTTESSNVEPE
jgi:HEAT repeat protein